MFGNQGIGDFFQVAVHHKIQLVQGEVDAVPKAALPTTEIYTLSLHDALPIYRVPLITHCRQ